MISTNKSFGGSKTDAGGTRCGLARLTPPLPLFVIAPLLRHIVTSITRRRPELFARLGGNSRKRFLIDPVDLPLFLLLKPDPDNPQLMACNRGERRPHDVLISGTFATLLRLIDGQIDSDALFFHRALTVTGDTEAIVALRNAIDDMDATLADDVAAAFGPLSPPVRALFDLTNRFTGNAS